MTDEFSPALNAQADQIKDVLKTMDALLDNKATLLKLHSTLRKAMRRLINPLPDSWLDAFIAQLLNAPGTVSASLWQGNLDEMLASATRQGLVMEPQMA